MNRLQLISFMLCLALLISALPAMARAEDGGALIVDGVAVTEENAADVLGNGVFRYDAEQNTLYVKGRYTGTDGGALIENRIEGLKIYADHPVNEEGKPSELTAPGIGILSWTDLTITGYPGLVLTAGEGANGVELRDGASLTLSNLFLTVRAGTHALAGGEGLETLSIKYSLLDLESTQEAVWGFTGALTMQGGQITEPPCTAIEENAVITRPVDDEGEPLGEAFSPNFLHVYTYADADRNEYVDVNDTVRLMGIIYMCKRFEFTAPEYDIDGDGENKPEDAAALLQNLFPEGELKRIIVASSDPKTHQCLGTFIVDGPEDIGDEELNFCAKAKYLSFYCFGEGLVPLCTKAGSKIPDLISILFG